MKLYYYKLCLKSKEVIILNFFYYKMIINKTCNKQRENRQPKNDTEENKSTKLQNGIKTGSKQV